MTTNSDGTRAADPADVDLTAAVNALKAKADGYVSELQQLQAEFATLAQLPTSAVAVAELDVDGRLVRLEIDREASAGLDGETFNREINIALANATRDKPQPNVDGLRQSAAIDPQGFDLTSVLDQLFGNADRLPTEPEVIWNDLHTVGVTTNWGALQEITCDPSWLTSASPALISEEILRVAAIALDAEKKDNNHG